MAQRISRIDITPLVGVALILVIVFMVTSPLIMAPINMKVDLPKARTIEVNSQENITISLSRDDQIALNEKQISQSELENELRMAVDQHPQRVVIIRADKYVEHEKVLLLLSIAKKAGAKQLALATLQRNREER